MSRLVLLAALLAAGCAHTLGYAGDHPGYLECKGKGTITGTMSGAMVVGYGGGNVGQFTLTGDCGPEGFSIHQGKEAPAPAKATTP